MTANRKTRVAPLTRKDILRFAPNFTAYVLPPDAVYLYSEDRKFFLHGELYCALAAAIGASGKSFGALVRELERDFPADKIQEALGRLVERRYVVPAPRASRASAGAVAGYWASLGLPPEAVAKSLQNCRVGIQAFEVQGA